MDSFIQPDSWNDTNSDDPALSSPKSAFKNIHLSMGGPITKDKLWFFAAAAILPQRPHPLGLGRLRRNHRLRPAARLLQADLAAQ